MEAINGGEIPPELVVDQILSVEGLTKPVGKDGTACFILSRAILTPSFYSDLIENTATIDSTTKDHLAFVVFHGCQSRAYASRDTHYSPLARRDIKYQIDGLSMRGNHHAFRLDKSSSVSFDQNLMDRVRDRDNTLISISFEDVGERAASILMEHFGIGEQQLPCLLFLSADEKLNHLVVELDQSKPLVSLYIDVLAPPLAMNY